MPPSVAAAQVTDDYRATLVTQREAASDAVAGMVAGIDLDVASASLARALAAYSARATMILAAAGEQTAETSAVYLLNYLAAGGVDTNGPVQPRVPPDPDVSVVRSALLWRLGRGDGRALATTTATAVAQRVARTQVATSAALTLAAGIAEQPTVTGWRRVTSRTCCRRCAVLATRTYPDTTAFFLRHPADRCTPEPVLLGRAEVLTRRAPTVVAA